MRSEKVTPTADLNLADDLLHCLIQILYRRPKSINKPQRDIHVPPKQSRRTESRINVRIRHSHRVKCDTKVREKGEPEFIGEIISLLLK